MIKEENINCTVEALVLASPEPVSLNKLSEAMDGVTPARIRQAVADLNNLYMGCGISFRIREVAGGYQVHILPDFEQVIKNMLSKQRTVRLTRAALETLAIIAYKQPVTKTEIEHIRGVSSDGVLHNLLERKLIVIAGRSDGPGRPLLYKTSSEFLKFFGLNRLTDLPRIEEIEEMIREAEPSKDQTELELAGNDRGPLQGVLPDADEAGEESVDEEDDMAVHADVEVKSTDKEVTDIDVSSDDEFDGDEMDDLENEPETGTEGAADELELISEIDSDQTRVEDGSDNGGNGNGSGSSDSDAARTESSAGLTGEKETSLPVNPRLSTVIYLPGDDAVVDADDEEIPSDDSASSRISEEESTEVTESSDRHSVDE